MLIDFFSLSLFKSTLLTLPTIAMVPKQDVKSDDEKFEQHHGIVGICFPGLKKASSDTPFMLVVNVWVFIAS
jgi:hypothetical protein